MSVAIGNKYDLELSINNVKVTSSSIIIESISIHESIHQALPTVDLKFVNNGSLIESSPLLDGSQVDLNIKIQQNTVEEEIKIETVLWSHEIQSINEGYHITMHCFLSAPDFFESRIESVNGSSFDVFQLMADRSRMQLISDSSIDKQVWIRSGIRGNVWLNDVINHTWSSPQSYWVYAVTRNRELLRYNLQERASRDSVWSFRQSRERRDNPPAENEILFSYPRYKSQSGFLNSFFGYGRNLSNFDVEAGNRESNNPKFFRKRVNHMAVNSTREVSQKIDSQGYGNALNVHENYFNAYAQNMRLKSFFSVSVEFISSYFRDVKLLDRASIQINNEGTGELGLSTHGGDYFVEKIVTTLNQTDVVRRFSLVREGYNSEQGYNSK